MIWGYTNKWGNTKIKHPFWSIKSLMSYKYFKIPYIFFQTEEAEKAKMGTTNLFWLKLLVCFGLIGLIKGQLEWVDPPPKYDCPKRPLYPCQCLRGSEEGIYVRCNNTNIASLAVGLKQVRTLIHTLSIENCNIEKVYGDLFRMLSVKILEISDTPIKDISDNTFDGVIANGLKVSLNIYYIY